jgi:hypothetical protein
MLAPLRRGVSCVRRRLSWQLVEPVDNLGTHPLDRAEYLLEHVRVPAPGRDIRKGPLAGVEAVVGTDDVADRFGDGLVLVPARISQAREVVAQLVS